MSITETAVTGMSSRLGDGLFTKHAGGRYVRDRRSCPRIEEVTTTAFDRQEEAFDRLFMVAPTTVAGVAAWLTHLAELEHPGGRSIVASIGEYYDTDFHAVVVQQFLNAAAVLRRKQPA